MRNDTDEVQDLIRQLKSLQLQQTDLLSRLERARENEAGTNTSETREFAVGDEVSIKNPAPFQANQGIITKIGRSRISVLTGSGRTIQRAPKNLVLQDERP
jgi:hypothetical protein